MFRWISLRDRLKGIYGEQKLQELTEKATAKRNASSQLTLGDDIFLHPEEYDVLPNGEIPRPVQVLYRDLIRIAYNRIAAGDLHNILHIDNIVVNFNGGRRRYTISKTTEDQGCAYAESLYRLSYDLHPYVMQYSQDFQHFLLMLRTLDNNMKSLKKLYNHPSLLLEEEIGLMVFGALDRIIQMERTDRDLSRRVRRILRKIDTQRGEEFYKEVYNYLPTRYTKDGQGFLYFYKDVLEHLNQKIEKHNAEEFERKLEGREEAMQEARAAAATNDLIQPMAALNLEDDTPRRSLCQIVREMGSMFPGGVLELYVFMVEEDIEFQMDEKEVGTPMRSSLALLPQPVDDYFESQMETYGKHEAKMMMLTYYKDQMAMDPNLKKQQDAYLKHLAYIENMRENAAAYRLHQPQHPQRQPHPHWPQQPQPHWPQQPQPQPHWAQQPQPPQQQQMHANWGQHQLQQQQLQLQQQLQQLQQQQQHLQHLQQQQQQLHADRVRDNWLQQQLHTNSVQANRVQQQLHANLQQQQQLWEQLWGGAYYMGQ